MNLISQASILLLGWRIAARDAAWQVVFPRVQVQQEPNDFNNDFNDKDKKD